MVDILKYEVITEDNIRLKVLKKPNVTLGNLFNSISFTAKEIINPQDLIDKQIFYRIYLNGILEDEFVFIITDYKQSVVYGDTTYSFTGYSKSYYLSETYYGHLPEITFNNLTELFIELNNIAQNFGVTIVQPFNYDLNNTEVSTTEQTFSQVLSSIGDTLGITFITNKKGDIIYPYIPKYTQSDILNMANIYTLNVQTMIFLKEEEFKKGKDYNAVIITNIDSAGTIQLETEEIDATSYNIYIYTSPLISTFNTVEVTASDGIITRVTNTEDFTVEEFVNFNSNKASVRYPIKNVLSMEFYNLPNTLIWNVGSSDIEIDTSDDLAVGKIVYTTERAHYIISGLVEPYVKIKAEVKNGD